jgi:DNA invertase Pin-like site-specific DNA recombinase
MYVRMSTEHQNYSIENQTAEMEKYALKHNLQVIETYSDGGKSGLIAKNRPELQRLLRDVQEGRNQYSVLLIYDVTRFGRYQDTDEGAYYEYTCRQAGIDVRYVAENFKNDNSMGSRLEKTLKRAMAGEYSKELSSKVFIGQCRLINYGFRQGGPAGFGLRRMLVDEDRKEKGLLERGQHKSIQTDRVILVPGPEEEVDIVRWIYRMFVDEGWNERAIADDLNRRHILTDFDRPWTRATVHQILINEKYIGTNVFNRRSYKLKEKRIFNDEEDWVKKEDAFKAIVDPSYFYNAQGIICERNRKYSNEEMLEKLQALRERQGWLSGILIDENEDMPSSSAYASRFGSLVDAYQLIGYTPNRDMRYIEINRHIRSLHPGIVEGVIRRIQMMGGHVHREVTSDLLIVNEEVKVSIAICRCQQTQAGRNRWKVRLDTGLEPDITIIVRMDATNEHPFDYYILPAIDVEDPKLRLADNNGLALDCYRFDELEDFFSLTRRITIQEAA